jgi:hypothetical protein
VEAFEDSDYTKLRTKTDADQFAVTHIVPVNGLVEGKTYYIRITASDSAVVPSMETLTSWGDGSDPIKLYATGEISQQACSNIQQGNNPAVVAPPVVSKSNEVTNEQVQAQKEGLQIQDVQNENHIFAQTKVQTIVSWITNIPATTVLLYREEKSNQQNELLVSNNKNIKHAAILTTLKPNTTYYFKAKSLDDKGNEIVSDEYSLRTPQPNTTIIQKIGISFNSLISGIKP